MCLHAVNKGVNHFVLCSIRCWCVADCGPSVWSLFNDRYTIESKEQRRDNIIFKILRVYEPRFTGDFSFSYEHFQIDLYKQTGPIEENIGSTSPLDFCSSGSILFKISPPPFSSWITCIMKNVLLFLFICPDKINVYFLKTGSIYILYLFLIIAVQKYYKDK